MKIFIDCSGSTGGHKQYWARVSEIIYANPDASFYFWDDHCRTYTYRDAIAHANKMRGCGGTYPVVFVNHIRENDSIIIVTDGQIADTDVKTCDSKLNNILADVTIEIINTGGQINLSVAAPFSRNCKNVKIIAENHIIHSGNTSDPIDLSIYQADPEKFITDYETIYKKIVMQTLGKRNDDLRNKLLDLQKNLLREIANRKFNEESYNSLRLKLVQGDFVSSINHMSQIISVADNNLSTQIEGYIQTLCKQCEGNTGYSFNLLQPSRVIRSGNMQNTSIADAPINVDYLGDFECPVSLDADHPVIMVCDGDPIFANVDKNLLEEIINNPLTLLSNEDLCKKIINRIDHPIGLSAAIELSKNNFISPITRNKIIGCLSFNVEKTHEKATMYTLAKMLFGNKLVGNPDMWIIVIYNILKRITYITDNTSMMSMIETYIIDRIKKSRTNITLSGLPIEPTIKAPTDIAIWYCVVSPVFYKNNTEDDGRNRLRSMAQTMPYLIDILNLLQYPFDEKFTRKRLELYHAFALMQNMLKNNIDVKSHIRSLYQNCIYKSYSDNSVSFAFFDGPISNPYDIFGQTNATFSLTNEEIYGLSLLLDKTKVNSSIMIPYEFCGKPLPKPKRNFQYKLYDFLLDEAERINSSKLSDLADFIPRLQDTSPAICPQTFRPYTFDLKLKKHWAQCSEELHGPLHKQLSVYNYFIDYVVTFGEYPKTKEDFIIWMYNSQLNRFDGNATDTLPFYTWYFVDMLYERYTEVLGKDFSNVSASKFITTVETSRDKEMRISMESL